MRACADLQIRDFCFNVPNLESVAGRPHLEVHLVGSASERPQFSSECLMHWRNERDWRL